MKTLSPELGDSFFPSRKSSWDQRTLSILFPAWMKTDKARELYTLRQQLNEPVFGTLKDQMGARRFLLRGIANVCAEFTLLATAFNLKTLSRVWNRLKPQTLLGSKQTRRMETYNIFEFSPGPGCILTTVCS